MPTLSDYIQFLRENKLFQEAYFYQEKIPEIFKLLGFTVDNVLNMQTDEVIKNLYHLHDLLLETVETLKQPKKSWEVELYGT